MGVTTLVLSDEDVRAAATAFLSAAFTVLEEQRVVPRPRWDPYLRVGRDYWGPDLMFLPEFKRFEQVLNTHFSERFDKPLGARGREFPNGYAFGLLEACIARLTVRDEAFDSESATVRTCIDELLRTLAAPEHEVACCRLVSHMTTGDGAPAEIGNVTVVPISVTPSSAWRDIDDQLEQVIPAATVAFNRDRPLAHDPPESLLVVRGRSAADSFEEMTRLSSEIDRFMMLIRLLFAGTAEPFFEVRGETQLVRYVSPVFAQFRRSRRSLIRRTTRLSAADSAPISALGELIDTLGVERTNMVVTSFDMALLKFSSSYLGEPWFEQVVDLSTALEAVLSGTHKEDIGLRLRSRASALLSGPGDPGRDIFQDVGELYGLRSELVHGGTLKLKRVRKALQRLATPSAGMMEGVQVALGVDRLRDLVRRAILARIILASGYEPLWPLRGDVAVDAALAEDAERDRWRSTWREELAAIGAASAADRARPAADALRDDPPLQADPR